MNITFLGNCQVAGLRVFLERALPHHHYRHLQHFDTDYGTFTAEQISDACRWADIVFFHKKIDDDNEYPTKVPKIPLAVWYQAGPFIDWVKKEDWAEVDDHFQKHGLESAVRFAVHEADLNYEGTWKYCLDRQIEKENSDVPKELHISHFMDSARQVQYMNTQNHPTSILFREWTLLLCKFLGETPGSDAVSVTECMANNNIVNLPCVDNVPTGARKILGLAWQSRPDADENAMNITRDYLIKGQLAQA